MDFEGAASSSLSSSDAGLGFFGGCFFFRAGSDVDLLLGLCFDLGVSSSSSSLISGSDSDSGVTAFLAFFAGVERDLLCPLDLVFGASLTSESPLKSSSSSSSSSSTSSSSESVASLFCLFFAGAFSVEPLFVLFFTGGAAAFFAGAFLTGLDFSSSPFSSS